MTCYDNASFAFRQMGINFTAIIGISWPRPLLRVATSLAVCLAQSLQQTDPHHTKTRNAECKPFFSRNTLYAQENIKIETDEKKKVGAVDYSSPKVTASVEGHYVARAN